MQTKTDAAQAKLGVTEYSPDLVQAYVVEAHRQRTEFIAMSLRTLSAQVRKWLTGSDQKPRPQAPRIVAQSQPRPTVEVDHEARRAA